MKVRIALLFASCCLLPHCAETESAAEAMKAEQAAQQDQGLSAKDSRGRITISEKGKPIAFIIPAMSNVEELRFINGQQQLVVKSRGDHGPATVQLFDSRSGRQEGKVMAFEIADGQPAWAAEMAE
ncbi:MAG: hypothetical protein AAGI48_10160 [Verrucomicrobiota bacterium]